MSDEARWTALLKALAGMDPPERRRLIGTLPVPAQRSLLEEWWWAAHEGQKEPEGDWRVWLIMAGRGFGKTRAGAEWVWARARERPDARIALVGASLDEVAKVMVEGESGLLACARSDERPLWLPSRGELRFGNGARAFAWTAAEPGKLRGPQHHHAWCDEIGKWRHGAAAWDNLRLGLRLGERPRALVTTTPAPGAALKAIAAAAETVVTRGRTIDNPHLPDSFVQAMIEAYGGTRLGRQELDGILFDDVAGALWSRALIENCRVRPEAAPGMRRVVVGVDPPASAEGDACGIVACGVGEDGLYYVLGDHSSGGLTPAGWAARVAGAAEMWSAERVVAEANNGGDMVGAVLAGAAPGLAVRLVHASRGKAARAEPVSGRFEADRARFAGAFPELEDELCALTAGGGFALPGRSPDRADAMIWAMSALMAPKAEPRITLL